MPNDSTPNPDFDSIYSPETQHLIESTGLNVKLSDLSEISTLMEGTADQANLAMDSLGPVTQQLAAAAKKDEAKYVENSRERYKQDLLKELDERTPRYMYSQYDWETRQRLSLENQTQSKRAETIEDPRVWHAVNNRTRKTPWGASYKLKLTEQLGEAFSKEELYLTLQLNDYVSTPDGYRTDFATGMLELHRIMSKKDFKCFCEALIKIGKGNEESADKKFKLIYSLKDRVAENFKLAEAIFEEDFESKDNWILEGKDFFKADPEAFSAFFRIMKELVTHTNNYSLGKEAKLFLYWLPLCGSSAENLKTLKELLPKLHCLGYGYDNQPYVEDLAADPNAFEKLKISSQILPPIESDQWVHEVPHFLQSLKTRSVAECEAVVTWAKSNSDDERKILGSNKFHLLRRILGQDEVFSSESIESWGVEFKKIKELLATEFKVQKSAYGEFYQTSEYDLNTKSCWILNGDFHAKGEDVKKMIEDYRSLQRKDQPDVTKEEWGNIDNWIQTSILWRLSEEDREEVKEALKKLPHKKMSEVLEQIHSLSKTYKDDHHGLIHCIEVLGKHSSASVSNGVRWNNLRDLYEEDLEKMDQIFTILDGVKGEDPDLILDKLSRLNALYEKDPQKLSEVLDVLNSMAEQENNFSNLKEKLRVIDSLRKLYEKDTQKLADVVKILNELEGWDSQLADQILLLKETFGDDLDKFKEVCALLYKVFGKNFSDLDEMEDRAIGTKASTLIQQTEMVKITRAIAKREFAKLKREQTTDEIVLTEENWLPLVMAFVRTSFDDFELPSVSREMAEKIVALFQRDDAKSFCLDRLKQLWLSYLSTGQANAFPLRLTALTGFVHNCEGAGPLMQFGALALFIQQARLALNKTNTRTAEEVVVGMKSMEDRFAKEKWSNEAQADFYNVSRDILQAAPSLYADFMEVFQSLSPAELKRFVADLYPLFHVLPKGVELKPHTTHEIW